MIGWSNHAAVSRGKIAHSLSWIPKESPSELHPSGKIHVDLPPGLVHDPMIAAQESQESGSQDGWSSGSVVVQAS